MARNNRREKATGSIYRKGPYWVAQVQDGYRDNGLPRFRQAQRKSQAEAVKALNELLAKVTNGVFTPEGRSPSVTDWLDKWLEEHVKPRLAPKTYDFYCMNVNRVRSQLAKVEVKRAKPADFAKLFSTLEANGASPNTIDGTRRTLRAAFGVAVKLGMCNDNPVTKTFSLKVDRKERAHLSPEQARSLLAALKDSPIESLVRFTLSTGLRIGEATGLTWADVELAEKGKECFTVRNQLQRIGGELALRALKTEKSRRTLPLVGESLGAVLNEKARQSIESPENPLKLVFLNPYGRPFSHNYATEYFKDALKKAGLQDMGLHSLRHSAATFMLTSGRNLHDVSRFLGHSQIAITSEIYGHVLSDALRDSARAMQDAYRLPEY